MSLIALPAAPNATPATAAKTSSLGTTTAPSAIHPPARTPAAATSRLWARTSFRTSITQHVLIQPLVAWHDPVARKLEGARCGGPPHALVRRRVAEQRHRAFRHLVDRPDRRAITR